MRGQESEGSGQHHIFTLNNYHSVQQEGTFMNPSSHNSGARESVEVFLVSAKNRFGLDPLFISDLPVCFDS